MCCTEVTVLSFPTMGSFPVFGVILPTNGKKNPKQNLDLLLLENRLTSLKWRGVSSTTFLQWPGSHAVVWSKSYPSSELTGAPPSASGRSPSPCRQPCLPFAQEVTPLLPPRGLTCSQAALWLAGRTSHPVLFIPEGGQSRKCLPFNAQGVPCCFSHRFTASSHHFHWSHVPCVFILLSSQLAA